MESPKGRMRHAAGGAGHGLGHTAPASEDKTAPTSGTEQTVPSPAASPAAIIASELAPASSAGKRAAFVLIAAELPHAVVSAQKVQVENRHDTSFEFAHPMRWT